MSGSENISSEVSDSDSDASVNQATAVQWFQIGILINYVFSDALKKNEPQKDENIKVVELLQCDKCGKKLTARTLKYSHNAVCPANGPMVLGVHEILNPTKVNDPGTGVIFTSRIVPGVNVFDRTLDNFRRYFPSLEEGGGAFIYRVYVYISLLCIQTRVYNLVVKLKFHSIYIYIIQLYTQYTSIYSASNIKS